MHTGTRRGPEALARRKPHNARGQRIRCRIETVFGACKRCHGLRRMRWIGLAKAGLQVRLAAIACTLRRTATLISAAA
jgi:IS5 family transposase